MIRLKKFCCRSRVPGVRLVMILSGFVLMTGCKTDKCFHTKGKINQTITETKAFNKLELNDQFIVELSPDSVNFVEFLAGANEIPFLQADVKQGELVISNHNQCNWLRNLGQKPSVRIHFQELDTVVVNGECDISCSDTIFSSHFNLDVWGGMTNSTFLVSASELKLGIHGATGDINLFGKADLAYIYSVGNAYIHAENFIAKTLYSTNGSTGDSYLFARDEAFLRIWNSGDIYLHGNPNLVDLYEHTGEGNLIQ